MPRVKKGMHVMHDIVNIHKNSETSYQENWTVHAYPIMINDYRDIYMLNGTLNK